MNVPRWLGAGRVARYKSGVRRLALFALARGIEQGQAHLAFAALRGFDPVLGLLARRRMRQALDSARLMTNVQDPVHQLRLAYLGVAGGALEADFDDIDGVAAEQQVRARGFRAPRRGPWLSLGTVLFVLLASAAAVAVWWLGKPFDPRTTPSGRVFGSDVPDFVVALSRRDAAAADSATKRATGAAAKKALGDDVVNGLSATLDAARVFRGAGLADRKARDGFEASTATLNRALEQAKQPYFVDADFLGNAAGVTPLLLGFYVQRDVRVEGMGTQVRVVHLWRLDDINLNQGYYGYTRPSTPAALVLLDQIESDLVRDVLPALPDGERMRLTDEETEVRGEPWVASIGNRGAQLIRSYFALVPEGRDENVHRVAELLARRRALIAGWRKDLAGMGHVLVVPERLVPEADYAEALSLRVPRAGLHEWNALHDELLEKDKLAAFERLRDHYVASVQRHEVQHRLDYHRDLIPVPPLLSELLGLENPLDAPYGSRAARARDEMSAFLASIIDSGPSPTLELALMARHAFNQGSLGNAYSYAVLAAFIGIARALGIDDKAILGGRLIRRERVARLFVALSERPPDKIRDAARRFYAKSYGQELPKVTTLDSVEHKAWRH